MNKKPLGVYIHFPFCKNICSYCDFVVDKNLDQIEKYLNNLLTDIEITSDKYNDSNHYVETVYIGGGTPSLLTPSQMSKILEKVDKKLNLSNVKEISMESNPASLDLNKMKEYNKLGINRISIGVQSFIKKELGLLKRNHSPNTAKKAILEAKEAGFDVVNFDMIFSLPNQKFSDWLYNLEEAIKLNPDHLSCYNLTYEEGTPLYNKIITGKLKKNDEDVDANIYIETINLLSNNGFNQYEVSNFSKQGKECLHNLGVWRNQEYLGFGVGAHWYINDVRYENTKSIQLYNHSVENKNEVLKTHKILKLEDKLEEFIILGLRAEGLNLEKLSEFNIDYSNIINNKIVKKLLDEKLISKHNLNIKLTNKGYMLADSITYELIKIVLN